MTASGPSRVAVIGVGNLYRRDDGIGSVAVGLARRALPGVDVVELDGEPTRLIDAWAGREVAVVVDAVCANGEAGTIHRIDAHIEALPPCAAHASSHRAGLAEAIALGRILDRLPDRLVVLGVEPADVTDGVGLSPPVSRALPELLRRIAAEVSAPCA